MFKWILVLALVAVAGLAGYALDYLMYPRGSWRFWKRCVRKAEKRGDVVPCANCGSPMLPEEIRHHNHEGNPIHGDQPHYVMENSKMVRCVEGVHGDYHDVGIEAAHPYLRQEELMATRYFKKNTSKTIH